MKSYRLSMLVALLAIGAMIFLCGQVWAAVSVCDDFESYPVGNLNTNNGGTGWTGAWGAGTGIADVVASEIDFGPNDGGSQAVRLTGAGGAGPTGVVWREFTPQNDTFYTSVLVKNVDVSDGFHQFGFSDDNDQYSSLTFIAYKDELHARAVSDTGGTANDKALGVFPTGGEHLIVAKVSKPNPGANFSAIDVYLDPIYRVEPDQPTVSTSATTINVDTFDTFYMRDTFNGELHFSNLAIGGTFADVMSGRAVLEQRFQEGVYPSASYVADSTHIRGDNDTPQDNDSNYENIIGYYSSPHEFHGLFEFDLSDLAAKADQGFLEVLGAEFLLTTRADQGGNSTDLTLNIHEYPFDFVESAARWSDPDGDGDPLTGDTTPGGTLGTMLTQATLNPMDTGLLVRFTNSEAFRAAVEAAIASGDHTLRLIAVPGGGSGYARFQDERAGGNPVYGSIDGRPMLLITYAVPEPSTVVLLSLGGLGLVAFARRRKQAA